MNELRPWKDWGESTAEARGRCREEVRREAEEIIDLGGDRVLVLIRLTVRGKGSGMEVELRGGDLVTMREGKLVRWTAYPERAQALEAAGLRE